MKKGIVITALFVVIVVAFLVAGQIFTVKNVNVVFYNKTGLTTESEIVSIIGLDKRNNIFSVNERTVKEKVAGAFYDNAIVVTDVERSFPDTVTVYVKERTPIFKLKVQSTDGQNRFVPTDKDFQRGTVYVEGDRAPEVKLIDVQGVTIVNNFDLPELTLLRSIANLFISFGFEEAALPYYFDRVVIDDEEISLYTVSGAVFTIGPDAMRQDILAAYNEYLTLSADQQNGKVFSIGTSSVA